MIVGGLYGVTPFVPTRLNVADDPTRDRQPRPPCPGLGSRSWSRSQLFALARSAASQEVLLQLDSVSATCCSVIP